MGIDICRHVHGQGHENEYEHEHEHEHEHGHEHEHDQESEPETEPAPDPVLESYLAHEHTSMKNGIGIDLNINTVFEPISE